MLSNQLSNIHIALKFKSPLYKNKRITFLDSVTGKKLLSHKAEHSQRTHNHWQSTYTNPNHIKEDEWQHAIFWYTAYTT